MKARLIVAAMLAATTILTSTGCDEDDVRLARMAEEHSQRQAQQSQQMVELQREVAQGARQLVAADAAARTELAGLQRELGQQQDRLEAERRTLAAQRRMDPILAAAITSTGLLLACLLPLVLCWYLLHGAASDDIDAVMNEILIEEFAGDHPRLLPLPASRLLGQAPAGAAPYDREDDGDDRDS